MALLQKAYLGATPLFSERPWFGESTAFVQASNKTTVTANTSAHTKGAYSEIIASTSANASLLVIVVQDISASSIASATLLDIATGASGSETNIVSDLAVGGALTTTGPIGLSVEVPFRIASGTRISARIQSLVTGGKTASVTLFLYNIDSDYDLTPTSVDVIGGNTANSQGISFSGASGTWVQAIASTSRAYRAVAIVPSTPSSTVSTITVQMQIGVGASGSEQAFAVTRTSFVNSEAVQSSPPYLSLFGGAIPAGSRLAVKHDIATGPTNYNFCLIGIP
jgi:hypothetical protein